MCPASVAIYAIRATRAGVMLLAQRRSSMWVGTETQPVRPVVGMTVAGTAIGGDTAVMPLTRLVPLALYMGRDHILTDANEVWRDLYLGPIPIGCPAREVFPGKMGRLFVEALDRARDTGEEQRSPCPDHESEVVVTPLLEGARVVGLVTGCGLERLGPMLASLPAQTDRSELELSA